MLPGARHEEGPVRTPSIGWGDPRHVLPTDPRESTYQLPTASQAFLRRSFGFQPLSSRSGPVGDHSEGISKTGAIMGSTGSTETGVSTGTGSSASREMSAVRTPRSMPWTFASATVRFTFTLAFT